MNLRGAIGLATAPMAWRSALVLMAATAVAGEWLAPRQAAEEAAAAAVSATDAAPSNDADPASTPAVYAAIAEHPLFHPSRQPWMPPPPAVPAKPPPPQTGPPPLANYALVGIAITNANRVALLKSSATAKTITLTEGKELEGWTLREIGRERLRFEAGGITHEMRFATPKAGSRDK